MRRKDRCPLYRCWLPEGQTSVLAVAAPSTECGRGANAVVEDGLIYLDRMNSGLADELLLDPEDRHPRLVRERALHRLNKVSRARPRMVMTQQPHVDLPNLVFGAADELPVEAMVWLIQFVREAHLPDPGLSRQVLHYGEAGIDRRLIAVDLYIDVGRNHQPVGSGADKSRNANVRPPLHQLEARKYGRGRFLPHRLSNQEISASHVCEAIAQPGWRVPLTRRRSARAAAHLLAGDTAGCRSQRAEPRLVKS